MFEDMELSPIAKNEFSDHHAPLPHKVKKTIWLNNEEYRQKLKVVTCMGKEHDNRHMTVIMRVKGTDAQYALLMHYHKMAGHIQRPPAARKYRELTAEDRVKAFNMYHEGHTVDEIVKELDSSRTNIYKIFDGIIDKHQKHIAISDAEKERIRTLHKCGTGLRQIAKKLGRQVSSIKYQLDKIKG